MKKKFFVIVFFTFSYVGAGQVTELRGYAPQFSDSFLLLQEIENPISGSSRVTDTLLIQEDGTFNQKLEISKATWLYVLTGLFKIYIYVEPNTGYEIELPPKTKKTQSNIRNPFFKPMLAHIKVNRVYNIFDTTSTIEDINTKIFSFDTLLAKKNQELRMARSQQKAFDTDSLIFALEDNFKDDTNRYFKDYRYYRYGIIKINSRDTRLKDIYDKYLAFDRPKLDNPAFMDLFGEMYKDFIFYYSRTEEGEGINYLINALHHYDSLKTRLIEHEAVPDEEYAELVILKEISDTYFKNYYRKEALLMILDSINTHSLFPKHQRIAKMIKEHLIRLKKGNFPPGFNLPDMDNQYKTLDDFKGKYVYLSFCTTDNYSCLMEFPFLKVLHNQHKDHLQIVTIIVAEDIMDMQEFMIKNDYNWTALFYDDNEELLQDYDIRAYPTNFLIGPEGKLIQSPAILATEGFEQQLFRIMRARGDL